MSISDTSGTGTTGTTGTTGSPAPSDHTGLRVLTLDECLTRVAATQIGRLAFHLDGEIAVLPVAHVLDGVDVCFRTAGDSKIEAAVDRERVAYEVDRFDPADHSGWSVLIQGRAIEVTDDDELARLQSVARRPWVDLPPDRTMWIRVRTQNISGRELPS
jgi:nitroimidazol reductase NimA-like FMN-containing flavoprotein (pyridoxamine 5'-phosphate oxidase superfamily)